MAKVFISYSRKDIEFAKRLTGELQKSELDFWIDWEGIPPTVDWWKEIEKGIEEADVFLFLISPDSAKSKVCGQEIDVAVKNGKRIIPIVVREIEWQETPPQLGHLNYIFFSRDDDFDTAIKKVMTAIQTDYKWAAIHRRLQVKALEWERSHKEKSFLLRGKDLQDAEFQLATNTSKDPHPTDLQREYVFNSRRAADRQRRITTGISAAGIVALAALVVFGFIQAGNANRNADASQRNEATAQAASTLALSNAMTAQAASTLAISNEQEARRQAEVALARQLAAQAQPLFAGGNSRQRTAVLLAIQSMRLFPTLEASQILLDNTLAKPLVRMEVDDWVTALAYSPDGKYVVSGSTDGTARVCDVVTGVEVARMLHDEPVYAVAFSPDDRLVASGSDDGAVRVWDASTGAEVVRFVHADMVNSVVFSPDGKYVASGSSDNTARVWEIASGREVARMTHSDYVNVVAFSPDGGFVVSGGADNTARVWDAATGVEAARMLHFVSAVPVIGGGGGGREGGEGVSYVAFSPDGRFVVSGGCDQRDNVSQCVRGSAILWGAVTSREIARVTHAAQASSAAFSPDGQYLVSGGIDGLVIVWEVPLGRELARMRHDAAVISVAFSPDGADVISASADNTARVWEMASGTEVARMTHDGPVRSAAFSPDGRSVVSAGSDGTISVWEPVTGKYVSRMNFGYAWAFSPAGRYMSGRVCEAVDSNDFCTRVTVYAWEIASGRAIKQITYDSGVISTAFSPDDRFFASGSYDNSIHVLDLASGTEIARMAHEEAVNSVAFSPDGEWLVSGSWDGTSRVWEAETGREVSRMTHEDGVQSAVFSPDGRYVVSGAGDSVRVWEAVSGNEVTRIVDTFVRNVLFSPDGRYVLTAGAGTSARVWDADTGEEIAGMHHNGTVMSIDISPDDRYAVSAAVTGVKVWETATGRQIAGMLHDDFVNFASFSPDGMYVVSAGGDGTARVWEALTGREIARMTYDDPVANATFSPDGKYVISASGGETQVWAYLPNDLIARACLRVTRNLTRAEWTQYIGNTLPYQAVCENLPIEPETTQTP